MRKLVSVLMMSSIVNLAHAWTDAGVNYFQPVAAYEALKKTDTNSSKDNKAPNNNIQNDFKVVTNIGESYPSEKSPVNRSRNDAEVFHDIMTNDEFYAMLLMLSKDAPEHANAAQFVMLMREMHRMNRNLELIVSHMKQQPERHEAKNQFSSEDISTFIKDGFKEGLIAAVRDLHEQKKLIDVLARASKQGGDMTT